MGYNDLITENEIFTNAFSQKNSANAIWLIHQIVTLIGNLIAGLISWENSVRKFTAIY